MRTCFYLTYFRRHLIVSGRLAETGHFQHQNFRSKSQVKSEATNERRGLYSDPWPFVEASRRGSDTAKREVSRLQLQEALGKVALGGIFASTARLVLVFGKT